MQSVNVSVATTQPGGAPPPRAPDPKHRVELCIGGVGLALGVIAILSPAMIAVGIVGAVLAAVAFGMALARY